MFTGCSTSHDYKSYVFDPAIVAKKVCINPLTDVDGVTALRFELYGCELDTGAEDSGTVDVITGARDSSIPARARDVGKSDRSCRAEIRTLTVLTVIQHTFV